MRKYIRHPVNIPIEYSLVEGADCEMDFVENLSENGLCFRSRELLQPGGIIHISINLGERTFAANACVMWCHKSGEQFETGIKFEDESAEYPVRMIEQLCHIQQYGDDVLDNEGRQLSAGEAATEWIEKYAGMFPR